MYLNLRDYLTSRKVSVFSGIQEGGLLNPGDELPLTPESPCTASFEDIYLETFTTPYFITLIQDPERGENDYFYQLDELYSTGQWFRELGVAHIQSENHVIINETDGTVGTLDLAVQKDGSKRLVLYRTRSIPEEIFVQQGFAEISSVKERNSKLPCKC